MVRPHRPLHLLWTANVASPYRRPVWAALAQRVRLVVALLEDDERLLRDGRRGAEWSGAVGAGYRVAHLPTRRVVRGEETYYALGVRSRLPLRGTDVVLLGGWESPAFWQALLLAKLHRIGTVGFYESTEATNRFRTGPVAAARAFFFRRLDAVVVPGASAAALLATFGVPKERTFVGFNAVDVAGFAAAADAERRRAAPHDGGHRFVYVGQLIERKNVDGLLRAFAEARRPEDVLTLIGGGEEQDRLTALADRLGLGGSLVLAGSVPNDRLGAALAAHDTLVLPSHREVWGLVVNEALAAGLGAVIAASAGVTASVRGMPGVAIAEEGDHALAQALAEARETWQGPIADPPILQHTPDAFAAVFAAAAESAAARRGRRSARQDA